VSVDFDPVRLDPGHRRVDPTVVAVIGVILALGVAVAKPWDQGTTPVPPEPSGAAVATPSTTARASPTTRPTARPASPVAAQPPTWADVASAVTSHDAWEVHALVVDRRADRALTGPPSYLDHWSAATPARGGPGTAAIDPGAGSVEILGITTPRAEAPRDARIWRVHGNDQLEWVDAAPIGSEPDGGSLLFVRPGVDGASLTPWAAGRYRVDVLTRTGIHGLSILVPDLAGVVPPLDVWTPERPAVVAAGASDPSSVRIGLFATVDGVGVSLPARQTRSLGNDEAWQDLTRAQNDVVATAYLPRATGLGVMLTSHAAVAWATIRRLAPDASFVAPQAFGGISGSQGRTPYVLFAAPGDGVWSPGVYAISVAWSDAGGSHSGSWHVELRPGLG
jgi:hypothetical protein